MFDLYSSPKFKLSNSCTLNTVPVGHLLELGDVLAIHAASHQKDTISLAGTYGKYAVVIQNGASYDVVTGDAYFTIRLLSDNGRTFHFDVDLAETAATKVVPSIQPLKYHLEQ